MAVLRNFEMVAKLVLYVAVSYMLCDNNRRS